MNSHNPSPLTNVSVPLVNPSKKTMADKSTTTDPIINKIDSHENKSINLELDFSIVDELKWTRASISLFELAKIAQFRHEIVNALPGIMLNLS